MQLICPKCEAIVDADDSGGPNKRRPVRCSSCNESWFTGGKTDLYSLSLRKPSEIDPEIARILQEEAAQEMSARKLENEVASQTSKDALKKTQTQSGSTSHTSESVSSETGYTPLNKRQRVILFVMAVLAGLTGLFIFAPEIVERFPAATDWVFSYVLWVNDMGALLNGLIKSSHGLIVSLELGGIFRNVQTWLGDNIIWIKEWVLSFSES